MDFTPSLTTNTGASKDLKDSKGRTALSLAQYNGRTDVVALLTAGDISYLLPPCAACTLFVSRCFRFVCYMHTFADILQ